MSQQREAFDAWYDDNGGPQRMHASYPPEYVEKAELEAAWSAWQACASEHAELLRKAAQALGETSAMLSACRLVVNDPVSRAQMTEAFGAAESTLALLRQHIEEKR